MGHFEENEIQDKGFDIELMRRLMSYAKPFTGLLVLSFIMILLATAVDLAMPWMIKIAIDDFISPAVSIPKEDAIRGVHQVAFSLFLLIIGGFFFNYIQVYSLSYVGQKVIHNMRTVLYEKVMHLPLSFFDKNPTGRLVTRLTNDMETLNELYTSVLVSFFKDIFLLGGIIIMMMQMDLKVSLMTFISIPVIVFVSVVFRKKSRNAYRLVRTRLAVINSSLSENISGMRIIQIFAQEERKKEEFFKYNEAHLDASMKELFIFALFRPSMDFIYSLALAMLIWFAGGAVLKGQMPFGVLFAFINYLEQFFRPIYDLAEKFNIMQSAMASSERIFQLMDEIVAPDVREEAVRQYPEITGKIEFKNVWFSYTDDEDWVLKDVSFVINPGETVAFVGSTGSGKTTVISLISRLYEFQKGRILIDDVDIRDIPSTHLRKQISSVLQDVFLFTGDIKSNIRLDNYDISDEKIKEVAKFVNADKFITKLPNTYDANVEENGVTFSSGERQLLAFARALAYDPRILILDEATSNIDTQTELLIQDAISRVIQNRTTIVVAHRLSTIQHTDNIIVLHKGKIREMGKHTELLNHKGIYHNLYLLQYKN